MVVDQEATRVVQLTLSQAKSALGRLRGNACPPNKHCEANAPNWQVTHSNKLHTRCNMLAYTSIWLISIVVLNVNGGDATAADWALGE